MAGTTIGSIDAYPGYFTIDLQRNGTLSGMMSVKSVGGAVWYHTWTRRVHRNAGLLIPLTAPATATTRAPVSKHTPSMARWACVPVR